MRQEEHKGIRDGKMRDASRPTSRGGSGVEQGQPEEEGGEIERE